MTPRKQRPARAGSRAQSRPAASTRAGEAAAPSLARRLARTIRNHPWAFTAALVGVHVALSLLALDPTPHTGGDNAGYITLARSLLERGAYLELWDPAEPLHTKYPPVFPLILAAAMALGVAPWVGLKLIVIAFSALGVAFSFHLIRARGRPALALGVASLLALSPGILLQNHWILSDVPFWGLTVLALWALETTRRRGFSARAAIAVAAVVLAYFTRSAGIPVLLAALVWMVWRRRRLQLAVMSGVALPLALLWWLRARSAGGVDYAGELWMRNPYEPAAGTIGVLGLLPRIGENFVAYVTTHLPTLLVGQPSTPGLVLSVAVTALALFGWARRLTRPARIQVMELALPLYIGLIFIWPAVWAGDRFLLPFFTAVLFYAGDGLSALATRFRPQLSFAAGATAVALIALLQLPTVALAARIGRDCQRTHNAGIRYACLPTQWQDFLTQAERLATLLPEDAVILSRKPRIVHVMSGGSVYSLTYPFTDEPQRFLEFADSTGARYLLFDQLDRLSQAYTAPVLMRRPQAFCLLEASSTSGTAVFGITADALLQADQAPGTGAIDFAVCDETYRR